MGVRTSSVVGCEKPHHARGWCDGYCHWVRDNGWAEPDHPLPVYGAGKRYRPVTTAYDRSHDDGPPARRA